MAYKIIVNKRFIATLSKVLAYLEKEWSKKIADDFLLKVDVRIDSLQHHPFIGGQTKFKGIRGIHVTKHNRMYYKVKGNKVTILNLYDTRRKNY
jgi:mRNA-degrading endonuclease YafQ of YafQ-DinJ toxin-antitoxin module